MERKFLHWAWPILATIASALLHALAFPPTDWPAFAWFALVPWFLALRAVGPGMAVALAVLWTEVASYGIATTLPSSASVYFLQGPFVGWALALGAWLVTAAVYYAGFALCYHALCRVGGAFAPLLAGAAWTLFELLRARLWNGFDGFTSNPWALLGYSQVDFTELLQLASVLGVYGIGFLVAAANAALANLVLAAWTKAGLRTAVQGALGVAVLVVLCVGLGRAALPEPNPGLPEGARPVAVVQGNLDLGSQWRPEFHHKNLREYLDLTETAIQAANPELVFWPEGAFTFTLDREPLHQRAIARVLAKGRADLIAGGPSHDGGSPRRYRNSIYLLGRDNQLRGRYDKQHLVPFSEYSPLSGMNLLRREFAEVQKFVPGSDDASRPLRSRLGPVGILTCNEALMPDVAGQRVAQGAVLLASPSNDTWLSDPDWAEMMLDNVRVRAVEQRRWLVRASTAGPSALIDPWGRVTMRSEHATRAVLTGWVQTRDALSVYGRIGDALGWVCALAVAGALAFASLSRRRSQTSPSRSSSQSPQ